MKLYELKKNSHRMHHQMLMEARIDRYMQMFEAIFKLPGIEHIPLDVLTDVDVRGRLRKKVQDELRWAMQTLQKDERIVWYARHVRYAQVAALKAAAEYTNKYNPNDPSLTPEQREKAILLDQARKALDQMMQRLETDMERIYKGRMVEPINQNAKTSLEHFMLQPIPAIQDYVFGDKTRNKIIDDLYLIEQEFTKRQRQTIPKDVAETGAELILQFPDGSAWWMLDRAYCEIEGNAMGHCGNVNGRTATDERILSYRRPVTTAKGEFWRPSLTFILDRNGRLGETKGRENTKPKAEYHPYIIELLKLPIIKGIKGGGYKPEANFKLTDLPEEQMDELLALKPDLASPNIKAQRILKKGGELPAWNSEIGNDTVMVGRALEEYVQVVDFDEKEQAFIIDEHDEADFLRKYGRARGYRSDGGDADFAAKILSGDDHIEIYDRPSIKDLDEIVPREYREQMREYLLKKVQEESSRDDLLEWLVNEGDLDEENVEDAPDPLTVEWCKENSIDIMKDVWGFMEEAGMEAYDEIINAYHSALETAATDALYKNVQDWFRTIELSKDFPDDFTITTRQTDDGPMMGIGLRVSGVEKLLHDEGGDILDILDDFSGYISGYSSPYYGYESASPDDETVVEALVDIGALTRIPEEKKD